MIQFNPGSSHVAAVPTMVKPAGLACVAELYLVSNAAKVVSSGEIPFVSTGAQQAVSFPITMPELVGTYPVYIDVYTGGILIGAFIALEDVTIIVAVPIFSYSNMNLQVFRIPGEQEFYLDVQCDIKNVGGQGTREVSVWISNHNFYVDPSSPSGYTWAKITSPSFAGWPSWAIPPGGLDWDAGTINLTLAPGETYHFHYAGVGAAYNAYTWVQMRDDAGGSSVIVKKYGGY